MKDTELKPCPFCGGEAKLLVGVNNTHWITERYRNKIVVVTCTKKGCYALGGIFNMYELTPEQCKEKAIKCWNRRREN